MKKKEWDINTSQLVAFISWTTDSGKMYETQAIDEDTSTIFILTGITMV
jgi:hypothetical protein